MNSPTYKGKVIKINKINLNTKTVLPFIVFISMFLFFNLEEILTRYLSNVPYNFGMMESSAKCHTRYQRKLIL